MSTANGSTAPRTQAKLPPGLDHLPFTPVQRRMMALFCDFQPHTKEELHACLDDDLALRTAIYGHFTAIRKLLPDGYLLSPITVGAVKMFRLFRVVLSPT